MGLVRLSDVSEKTEEKKTTSSQKSVDLTVRSISISLAGEQGEHSESEKLVL